MKVELGKYVLIGSSCLAMPTRVDASGFDFDCTNGAWSGRYTFDGKKVRVNGHETYGGQSLIHGEPPPEVMKHGYNAIIPWMQANGAQ